ncbi:choice-of-anchor B family protein [bacterium]|nr:choice-of-anchor B family protein [bacterium]
MTSRIPLALIALFALLMSCGNSDSGVNIRLVGKLEFNEELTDVWGFVDDATGLEYALVGFGSFGDGPSTGTYIVNVADPTNPVAVTRMDSIPGFDMKVWQNFLYVVNGFASSGVGQIVDIADPENPLVVGSFPTAHNIFIADNGFMYLENDSRPPGLRIFNLNADPTNPVLVWQRGNFGHDATVVGNRLYDFHGRGGTNIYDVTDPTSPNLLSAIDAPFISFHHSGWPTEDGNFLFICNELSNHPDPDITVWDISNLNNPEFVGEYKDELNNVHNLYVVGDFAFVSYYNAGFRVFDVSNPTQMQLVDEFDTSPNIDLMRIFQGAFGAFPFTSRGSIFVSDSQGGLHIFEFNGSSSANRLLLSP